MQGSLLDEDGCLDAFIAGEVSFQTHAHRRLVRIRLQFLQLRHQRQRFQQFIDTGPFGALVYTN